MEFIFEVLVQFFGEILLQFLAEVSVHRIALYANEMRHKRPDPIFAGFGYLLLGVVVGGISLILLPHSLIMDRDLRLANLFVTPLISALLMMLLGRLRERHGKPIIRLDRFGYALIFAFTMTLVRFWATSSAQW